MCRIILFIFLKKSKEMKNFYEKKLKYFDGLKHKKFIFEGENILKELDDFYQINNHLLNDREKIFFLDQYGILKKYFINKKLGNNFIEDKTYFSSLLREYENKLIDEDVGMLGIGIELTTLSIQLIIKGIVFMFEIILSDKVVDAIKSFLGWIGLDRNYIVFMIGMLFAHGAIFGSAFVGYHFFILILGILNAYLGMFYEVEIKKEDNVGKRIDLEEKKLEMYDRNILEYFRIVGQQVEKQKPHFNPFKKDYKNVVNLQFEDITSNSNKYINQEIIENVEQYEFDADNKGIIVPNNKFIENYPKLTNQQKISLVRDLFKKLKSSNNN